MKRRESSYRARWIRKTIRECLALAFWLHAVYVFNFLPLPHIAPPDLPRYAYNAALVLFILNYSFLSNGGWWSALFDLLYIYALPFIYMAKLAWWLLKISYRNFKSGFVLNRPRIIVEPLKAATESSPKQTEPATEKPEKVSKAPSRISDLSSRLFKFALLWSLLILTVEWRPALCAVIAITCAGICRAVWGLWEVLSLGSNSIQKMEERLELLIRQYIDAILSWDGVSEPAKIRQAANALNVYRSAFDFISNNARVLSKWALTTAIIVTVPFYCYNSLLFANVYFGIAKLQHISYGWANALVDSLFMPFAWSALPNSIPIKALAGLQATYITVIGYKLLFRQLGDRLEAVTKLSVRLRNPLDQELLRTKLTQIEQVLGSPSGQPKMSQPTAPDLPLDYH